MEGLVFHALLAATSSLTDAQTAGFVAAYFGFIGIAILVSIVFGIVVYWRIATKAGYPGPMSLLMFVPLVNFIIILIFAFSEWPIERRLREVGGMLPAPGIGPYVPPGGGGYAPAPAPMPQQNPYATVNPWAAQPQTTGVPPPPPQAYLPDPPPPALPPESL